MTTRPRVVLDTSVVVSAALQARGIPRSAFDAAAAQGEILISQETVAELQDVFLRAKFDRFVSAAKRLEFLAAYVTAAEPIEIESRVSTCRDPKDNMILDVALNGTAHVIVSGDGDLLTLHPLSLSGSSKIEIVTARQFVEQWLPNFNRR
jgi:putative PIN family toxin of toxin-antitoxin system